MGFFVSFWICRYFKAEPVGRVFRKGKATQVHMEQPEQVWGRGQTEINKAGGFPVLILPLDNRNTMHWLIRHVKLGFLETFVFRSRTA
jgi:hypothetical protein